MEDLLNTLLTFTPLNNKLIEPVLHFFDTIEVPSRKLLSEPGMPNSKIWIVNQGLLRAYIVLRDGRQSSVIGQADDVTREVTTWISPEGGILIDTRSFLKRDSSTCYIEALESCKLYSLTYENYLLMKKTDPHFTGVLLEHVIAMADLRVYMSALRSPINRLRMFEKTFPGLSARLSVMTQASYLNIDRATLSRIRARTKYFPN